MSIQTKLILIVESWSLKHRTLTGGTLKYLTSEVGVKYVEQDSKDCEQYAEPHDTEREKFHQNQLTCTWLWPT